MQEMVNTVQPIGTNRQVPLKTRLYRKARQTDLYWRYIANRKPWIANILHPPQLTETQTGLVGALKRNGIVVSNVDALFPASSIYHELEAQVWKLETDLAQEIKEAARQADQTGVKVYMKELLGSCPLLDPDNIFVRFALQPAVLNLANSYLGVHARLSFFNVWHNFPSHAPARNAQLWHRDLDDRRVFKLFIYFTDVGDQDGPLTYAPGTHADGEIRREPETFGEEGTSARRSDDGQMAAVVPKDRWVIGTGPKGTAILVDTWGYHKGGLVRAKDRIVYTCMFTSQAANLRGTYLTRMSHLPKISDPAVAFALDGETR